MVGIELEMQVVILSQNIFLTEEQVCIDQIFQ